MDWTQTNTRIRYVCLVCLFVWQKKTNNNNNFHTWIFFEAQNLQQIFTKSINECEWLKQKTTRIFFHSFIWVTFSHNCIVKHSNHMYRIDDDMNQCLIFSLLQLTELMMAKKKNLLNFFCLKLLNQLVNVMFAMMFPYRNLEAIYIFHLLMKKMTNFFSLGCFLIVGFKLHHHYLNSSSEQLFSFRVSIFFPFVRSLA